MDLTINANRFSGRENVDVYDRFRPKPPSSLLNLTKQYLGDEILHLIDIGCGSGLSTQVWKNAAKKITAVDPSLDMLNAVCKKFEGDKDFEALQSFAHEVPLDDHCADLITCSQAFHWMDPLPTLKEFNRLLSPGGLLVIYDCLWPPSVNLTWEQAFIDLFDRIKRISEKQSPPLMYFWNKAEHLSNVKNSGYFSHIKQVGFNQEVVGGVDYFIGLAESQGGLQALRRIGMSDDDIGWNAFKKIVKLNSLNSDVNFTLHYTVIFAFK